MEDIGYMVDWTSSLKRKLSMCLPREVDLSRGRPPEEFYVCLIPDRMGVEAWRASSEALDYSIPSSNWCAMTCLRMLLLLHNKEAPQLEELFARACIADVYRFKEDRGGWAGAYHVPLVRFIRQFGFRARLVRNLPIESLAATLNQGLCVVLRVGPDIRFPTSTEEPAKRTGHFVLVYGYCLSEQGVRHFLIQNSAGFASLNSQVGVKISEERIRQVSSGMSILIRPRRTIT